MNHDAFWTMRDIGKEFGLTNHQVGKVLTQIGLRIDGKPTGSAFQDGWVHQRFAPDGQNYMWAWSVTKTRALLQRQGFKPNTIEESSPPHGQ